MQMIVTPGAPLRGEAVLPGDKSLSHRALLFAALANGESVIENFLISGVTRAMLNALTSLSVPWTLDGATLRVRGRGLRGWQPPTAALDCGNSATTLRLMAGALAATGTPADLTGSEGLRKRPMDRVVAPLQRMGVPIAALGGDGHAPLRLSARLGTQSLSPLTETLAVASAQVKTGLLLAALAAPGTTILREPGPSRDHSERMLSAMGAQVQTRVVLAEDGSKIYETAFTPPVGDLNALHMRLPGDFSSAAFLIVAAVIVPGSEITLRGVGLNPTRTGLLDALSQMGLKFRVANNSQQGGEPCGDLIIASSTLRGGTRLDGELVVRMIDEFSVFGAAAAYAPGQTTVRDALELRYKESDRIRTLVGGLTALGIRAEEVPDGFDIWGGRPRGGRVNAAGDHRVAMAMAVAALAAEGETIIDGAEIIQESFPEFAPTLTALGANLICR